MFRPWLQTIDHDKRILEIGPLTTPMVPKIPGKNNVCYADIRSTEDVKGFYKNSKSIDINAIVPIDYVIKNSYTEALKDIEPFDYVILTHVIEHMPNFIGFFKDIVNILKPNGKLCLTIPDKRYCFDHYRQPTSFAECYDIYHGGRGYNDPLRVLDGICSSTAINDPVFWWENPVNYTFLKAPDSAIHAYESALNGAYYDVHFSVFTPESFLLLIFYLTKYVLFPFEILEFYGTEKNTFEFNVVLQKNIFLLDDTEENSRVSDKILTLLSDNSDNKTQILYYEKLRQENTQLHSQLNEIQAETQKLLEEKNQITQRLDSLICSRSWRITKPLRFLSSVVRKMIPSKQ